MMVDIEAVVAMSEIVTLPDMRANPALEEMPLLMKGQRLSVQPVPQNCFEIVCEMGGLQGIPT